MAVAIRKRKTRRTMVMQTQQQQDLKQFPRLRFGRKEEGIPAAGFLMGGGWGLAATGGGGGGG